MHSKFTAPQAILTAVRNGHIQSRRSEASWRLLEPHLIHPHNRQFQFFVDPSAFPIQTLRTDFTSVTVVSTSVSTSECVFNFTWGIAFLNRVFPVIKTTLTVKDLLEHDQHPFKLYNSPFKGKASYLILTKSGKISKQKISGQPSDSCQTRPWPCVNFKISHQWDQHLVGKWDRKENGITNTISNRLNRFYTQLFYSKIASFFKSLQ